jgi:glycosyltransferase involved in cell wall biosynthesis
MSYRNERTVLQAFESLTRQDEPLELVLSHSGGGSTPDRVRESFPEVRIAAAEHRRMPGAARNAGIAASTAPYVGFLAADCRALPGWAGARVRRHVAGAPAVSAAMAPPQGPAAAVASYLLQHSARMPHLRSPARALSFGVSYERGLLERFGPFREDLPTEEDVELNDRLIAAGVEIEWAPEVAAEHAYPRAGAGLVADQLRRGRMLRAIRRPERSWPALAMRGLFDAPSGIARAVRPGSPLPARRVLGSSVLVTAGAAAFAAGAALGTAGEDEAARR